MENSKILTVSPETLRSLSAAIKKDKETLDQKFEEMQIENPELAGSLLHYLNRMVPEVKDEPDAKTLITAKYAAVLVYYALQTEYNKEKGE